jgi:hypothetical protein
VDANKAQNLGRRPDSQRAVKGGWVFFPTFSLATHNVENSASAHALLSPAFV